MQLWGTSQGISKSTVPAPGTRAGTKAMTALQESWLVLPQDVSPGNALEFTVQLVVSSPSRLSFHVTRLLMPPLSSRK